MPIASSSLSQLRYIQETAWGVTPATGNAVDLRMTEEKLDYAISKEASKEINSARQIRSMSATKASATGSVNIELSYKEYDPLLSALLADDWLVYGSEGSGAAREATWTTTGGVHKIVFASAPTGSESLINNLRVGQYIRIVDLTPGGLVNARNKGVFQVVARDATSITVPEGSLVADPTAKEVKLLASRLTNGALKKSFTLEVEHSDSQQFFAYRGMQVNKFDLDLSAGSFVTGSFDFIGRDSIRGTVRSLPGTPVASQSFPVVSAVSGVRGLLLDGSEFNTTYQTYIKNFKLMYDNKLIGLDAIGVLGNADVLLGTIELKGSLQVYLSDGSLYDDFLNSVRRNLSVLVQDPQGNGYVFTIPRLEFSSAKRSSGSNDQPVMLDLEWTALMDETTGKSIFIDRI